MIEPLFRERTISSVGRATGNPVAKARPQLKCAVTLFPIFIPIRNPENSVKIVLQCRKP